MATTGQAKKKKKGTRLWLIVHSWLALPLWVLIFFVCLTGTIATVSQELVWLVNPDVRAFPPRPDAVPLTYDAILEAIREAKPDVAVSYISRLAMPYFALDVLADFPDGTSRLLFVNPYTGEIQGTGGFFEFRYFVRALHGWLLVPFSGGASWGWYIVSGLSVPLLGSLVSGIVIYKKFWRAYLNPRIRLRSGARIFWGDFHRLIGIWSIPFIAIIAVTASWFLIQHALTHNNVTISTARLTPPLASPNISYSDNKKPRWVSLDRAVNAVSEVFPGFTADFISLPGSAAGHIAVSGRSAYPLIFGNASVDPYSGKVLITRGLSDRSWLELVTESMRPLHTGDFAGLWLKLVYFFFGLLFTMMVFSGMMIWLKRTAQATVELARDVKADRAISTTSSVREATK